MSWIDSAIAMLPEHLLLAGVVALIALEIAAPRRKQGTQLLSLLTVTFAAAAAAWLSSNGFAFAAFAGHYSVDPAAFLAKAIVLALAVPVLLISRDDSEQRAFPILLLSSLYGVCLLLSADSFLTLFLGLELMSLPVYALVLLAFRRPQSAEAALKYLVLGGTATATLLMGVSLLYGSSGSLALSTFASALGSPDTMANVAVVLVLVALVIKAGVLLAAVRLFGTATVTRPMADLLAILPLVSIVWGNLAAMRQQSFRRMI